MNRNYIIVGFCLVVGLPGLSMAQSIQPMDHAAQMTGQNPTQPQLPTEPGQSAFATIAEIVSLLRDDPETDWQQVDIDALRAHLVDMDAVTLKAGVESEERNGGAAFTVTSDDQRVTGSIRAMILAHVQTMSGTDGLTFEATEVPGGARLIATGADVALIRGLGFFGILSLGNHHPVHHLALARGVGAPHE